MKYAVALLLAPAIAGADPRIDAALDDHILPRFAALTETTEVLANAQTCAVEQEWSAAADAWIAVSHLRFGPSEVDNRAFSLAFWPDPRGSTQTALRSLLADDAPDLADVSVAGRGFYAMEFLLFDPAFAGDEMSCALIARLADDAHETAKAIELDWQDRYADLMRETGNDTYHDETEVLQELYKSLVTGLDFTADMRLGRPLGTFDRPRPTRAEMRRSGRSLANISTSLTSLEELALILSQDALAQEFEARFQAAQDRVDAIAPLDGGADLSLVENVADRIKVESLQTRVLELRAYAGTELGPELGVIEGFNSLDGD